MGSHMLGWESGLLVVIDVQERLAASMPQRESTLAVIARLVRVARELGMPVVYTEQYPAGLGSTVPEVVGHLPSDAVRVEKMTFDCCNEPAFMEALEVTGRRQVLLVGMEAHICVTQTALHMLERGYEVHVASDGVCSAHAEDSMTTLDRLRNAGVEVTVSESAIYEMVGVAGTDEFRKVLAIVKERKAAE